MDAPTSSWFVAFCQLQTSSRWDSSRYHSTGNAQVSVKLFYVRAVQQVIVICLLTDAGSCRIQRDVAMRGRDVGGVIEQYTKFVKPSFDQYVGPSRKHADVIIPWARYHLTMSFTIQVLPKD